MFPEAGSALNPGYIGKTVDVLERDHPAWILRGQGAHLIELLNLISSELKLRGREVLLKLILALGSNNDRCDKWFGENPGQGNRGHAGVVRCGDRAKYIEDAPGTLLVRNRKIER